MTEQIKRLSCSKTSLKSRSSRSRRLPIGCIRNLRLRKIRIMSHQHQVLFSSKWMKLIMKIVRQVPITQVTIKTEVGKIKICVFTNNEIRVLQHNRVNKYQMPNTSEMTFLSRRIKYWHLWTQKQSKPSEKHLMFNLQIWVQDTPLEHPNSKGVILWLKITRIVKLQDVLESTKKDK